MINFPAFTSSWGDCRLHGLITLSYIINLELLPWIGHYANRQSDCHSISWYLSGHLESYSYTQVWFMMTSSNGNIFRVTGLLWGEFTGLRWSPLTKASDAELWCFLWSASEKKRLSTQSRRRWFQTPSRSLWSHCNVMKTIIITQGKLIKVLADGLPRDIISWN